MKRKALYLQVTGAEAARLLLDPVLGRRRLHHQTLGKTHGTAQGAASAPFLTDSFTAFAAVLLRHLLGLAAFGRCPLAAFAHLLGHKPRDLAAKAGEHGHVVAVAAVVAEGQLSAEVTRMSAVCCWDVLLLVGCGGGGANYSHIQQAGGGPVVVVEDSSRGQRLLRERLCGGGRLRFLPGTLLLHTKNNIKTRKYKITS